MPQIYWELPEGIKQTRLIHRLDQRRVANEQIVSFDLKPDHRPEVPTVVTVGGNVSNDLVSLVRL